RTASRSCSATRKAGMPDARERSSFASISGRRWTGESWRRHAGRRDSEAAIVESTGPGQRTDTPTADPSAASSRCRLSEIDSTAALLAQYAEAKAPPSNPPVEAVLTT